MKTFILALLLLISAGSIRAQDVFTNAAPEMPPASQLAAVLNQVILAESRCTNAASAPQFVSDLAGINVSQCPADFRAAWKNFMHALIQVQTHSTTANAFFAVVDLLHLKTERFADGLANEQDLRAALLEIKTVCAQYGVDSTPALRP